MVVDFVTPAADVTAGYEPCVADEPHPARMRKSGCNDQRMAFDEPRWHLKPPDIDDLHACTGTSRSRPTATIRPQRTDAWMAPSHHQTQADP